MSTRPLGVTIGRLRPIVDSLELPRVAIAEGAPSTDPAGSMLWSITVGKVMESTGTVWRSISSTGSGGGGGGSWTEIEVDFGTNPVSSKTFTVTAPTVSPSSTVTAVLSGKPATGRAPGDADADAFSCACTPSSGSFRLAAHCTTGRVVGRRIFQYLIA